MAKQDENKKAEASSEDAALEARVKRMMDPSVHDEPATAPEIGASPADDEPKLPVPDKPLQIKIVHDTDSPDEPSTAPEVAGAAKKGLETTPDIPVPEEPKEPEPAKPEETPEVTDEPVEDSETSSAVDDIVRKEGDELLKAADKKNAATDGKRTFGQKLKAAIADLWKNPKKRKTILGLLFLAIAAVALVPQSRYFVLNTFGVRASTSIRVLDQSTQLPLKNVKVSAHGVDALTNDNGDVTLNNVKLGQTQFKIEKRAFAPVSRKVTIGWGSNPQGEEKLVPTGVQYAFKITDYASGKPIEKAAVVSGEADAFSDKDGKALLTMDTAEDIIEIQISSPDRRTEILKFNADTKEETAIKMVPARKHVYISERDGTYDVYAAYADGKDEKLILKGTGEERDDIALAPHPTDNVVALVSTRTGKKNEDGFLLSTLTLIDMDTKKAKEVQTAERVQMVGWIAERLIYVRVISGASADSPDRNRLMAYHYKDDTDNQLAAGNSFNDVITADGRVYYAPSAAYLKPGSAKLYSANPNGTETKTLLDKEVWNMFHTSYDHVAFATNEAEWYDYRLGDERPTKLSKQPAGLKTIIFTNSPDNSKSLWVDQRDGNGVLIVRDVKAGTEETLQTQDGLKMPVRWLNNSTVVFRVNTDTETADYVMSLDGGEPKKIKDVTDADGIDVWYFYR